MDVEEFASRGLEDAPQACCLFASRDLEVRCRCRDIEVWRSGALEACCGCSDV